MKFYISLPISGHTCDDVEQRIGMAQVAIEKYAKRISGLDPEYNNDFVKHVIEELKKFDPRTDIYNPLDLNSNLLSDDATENGYDNAEAVEALTEDIKTIISAVDVVVLCDGWESSKGCTLEMMTALLFGKSLLYLVDGDVVCPDKSDIDHALSFGNGIISKSQRYFQRMPYGKYSV